MLSRITRARSELEALTKLKDMEDYLEYLTPEWLKSLIVDDVTPPQNPGVVDLVKDNPEWCLNLLQVHTTFSIY